MLGLLCTCSKDIPVINQSEKFAICNDVLEACAGSKVGEYCLFGFKWGNDQDFLQVGVQANGPESAGGNITFSFQERNGLINTHTQVDVPSESWGEILDCAQDQIRRAMEDWQAVADLTFEELPENSESDIRFYVAAIIQSGVAFPNYKEQPCIILNGTVIFDANSREKSCNGYYINALHEVGHVLGLGHVGSDNIMADDRDKFGFDGLQSGDIMGIRQIYGEK